jgi:hypothetical protein
MGFDDVAAVRCWSDKIGAFCGENLDVIDWI